MQAPALQRYVSTVAATNNPTSVIKCFPTLKGFYLSGLIKAIESPMTLVFTSDLVFPEKYNLHYS